MTREEAIEVIEQDIPCEHDRDLIEALEMAISALSEELSEDGTLTVHVADGSKVSRVFVKGDNIFGGLYYPDSAKNEGEQVKPYQCEKCQYFSKAEQTCHYSGKTRCVFDPLKENEGDSISKQAIEEINSEIPKIHELFDIAYEYNKEDSTRTELSQKCTTYLLDVWQTLGAIVDNFLHKKGE